MARSKTENLTVKMVLFSIRTPIADSTQEHLGKASSMVTAKMLTRMVTFSKALSSMDGVRATVFLHFKTVKNLKVFG